MPSVRLKPPGTAADPFAPTVRVVLLESKVPSELEQLLVVHTSNVTFPVSCESESRNVAVSVGVALFRRAVSAGLTSVGVDGGTLVVLFVIDAFSSVAVTAGLPVASAMSRTIGSLPGLV